MKREDLKQEVISEGKGEDFLVTKNSACACRLIKKISLHDKEENLSYLYML